MSQTLGPTGGTALNNGITQCVIGTTVQQHTGFNGSVADFRVYNKALTEDEIYDLSKGLIAHYLLHNGPNRYKILSNGYKFIEGINGHSAELNLNFTATEKTTAYIEYYPTNSNSPFGSNDQKFNISGNSGRASWRWGGQTHNSYGQAINQRLRTWFGKECKGMPGNITLTHTDTTFTSTSIYIFGRNGDAMSGNIYQFKIWDDGILSHDFQPAIRNSDNKVGFLDLVTNTFFTHNSWTAIEVADTVENDCAGWLHGLNANGFTFNNQYINTGPRYDRAINFTATSQYLKGISLDNAVSICFWGKAPATWPNSYQCYFSDFINYAAMGSGGNGFLVPRARSGGPLYSLPSTLKLDDWNFFVIIINTDKTTKAVYVNNELCNVSSSNNFYTHNTNEFLINARNNGSYTNGMNQAMSDLRVYATELTEEDRNRLYAMGRY